jgi:hypothetical protein
MAATGGEFILLAVFGADVRHEFAHRLSYEQNEKNLQMHATAMLSG